MHCLAQEVRLAREPKHRSAEHSVKIRQKMRLKAKVGQSSRAVGRGLGYWQMAMLRVAPIRLVQMEMRQPMMLAARLLARKTWKKVDMPIWARTHPSSTTRSTSLPVWWNRALSMKKQPNRKNTKLVVRLMTKLNKKVTSQQLLIFMPFILIICISFSSFSSTTRYRKTGSSRLSDTGNSTVVTVLTSKSTKIVLTDTKGMQMSPDSTLGPATMLMQASEMACCKARNPSPIRQQDWKDSLVSLRKRMRVTPSARWQSSTRMSLILRSALSWCWLAEWKVMAPSGSESMAVLCRTVSSYSWLRSMVAFKMCWFTDWFLVRNSGANPQQQLLSYRKGKYLVMLQGQNS